MKNGQRYPKVVFTLWIEKREWGSFDGHDKIEAGYYIKLDRDKI